MDITLGAVVGIGVDIAVSVGVSRIAPGLSGALIGGGAAGSAGRVVENLIEGRDFKDGVGNAFVLGAAGAGAGHLAGQAMLKLNTRELSSAEKAIAEARTLRTAADPAGRVAEETNAKTALKSAQEELDTWDNSHDPSTYNKKGFEKKRDPRKILRDQRQALEDKLTNATHRYNKAASNFVLDEAHDVALKDGVLERVEEAKKVLETKGKLWQDGKGVKGRPGEFEHAGLGMTRLRAAGAGLGLASVSLRDGKIGSKNGGGTPNSGSAPQPPELIWAGKAAAGSHYLKVEEPFHEQGYTATNTTGGFLLQPKNLDPTLALWHAGSTNSVAKSLVETYELFGDVKNNAAELKKTETPRVRSTYPGGQGSDVVTRYQTTLQSLKSAAHNFDTIQHNVTKRIADVKEASAQGKENIADLISGMNGAVSGLTSNAQADFMDVLAQAYTEIIDVTETAAGQNLDASKDVNAMTKTLDDTQAGNDAKGTALLDDKLRGLESRLDDKNLQPPDLTGDRTANPIDRINRAIDNLQGANGIQPGFMSPAAGMGGLMGDSMWSSILPFLMTQMQQRSLADTDQALRSELDPRSYDGPRYATMPQPAPQPAQPAGATPWSNQSTVNATPAGHTGPPSGATASPAAGTRPAHVPGPDGSVVYRFPDGRTQNVSPMVAQALDAAFANKKGTDAQAAYSGTSAKWTDEKKIGVPVDPNQLMTGDIGFWMKSDDVGTGDMKSGGVGTENQRTAVLVVFGLGDGTGTVEAVVDGELKLIPTDKLDEMSDSAGEFGEFVQFFHPPGIELAASKDKNADAGVPIGGDQSAGMAVPAMAAPA